MYEQSMEFPSHVDGVETLTVQGKVTLVSDASGC